MLTYANVHRLFLMCWGVWGSAEWGSFKVAVLSFQKNKTDEALWDGLESQSGYLWVSFSTSPFPQQQGAGSVWESEEVPSYFKVTLF